MVLDLILCSAHKERAAQAEPIVQDFRNGGSARLGALVRRSILRNEKKQCAKEQGSSRSARKGSDGKFESFAFDGRPIRRGSKRRGACPSLTRNLWTSTTSSAQMRRSRSVGTLLVPQVEVSVLITSSCSEHSWLQIVELHLLTEKQLRDRIEQDSPRPRGFSCLSPFRDGLPLLRFLEYFLVRRGYGNVDLQNNATCAPWASLSRPDTTYPRASQASTISSRSVGKP